MTGMQCHSHVTPRRSRRPRKIVNMGPRWLMSTSRPLFARTRQSRGCLRIGTCSCSHAAFGGGKFGKFGQVLCGWGLPSGCGEELSTVTFCGMFCVFNFTYMFVFL